MLPIQKVDRLGRPVKHGMHRSAEYRAWQKMKDRCFNPRSQRYYRYGARGISVCNRWMSFELFFEDMGPRPSNKHSIERKDNNGSYCPENCEWALPETQNRNRGDNVIVEIDGVSKTAAEWATLAGLNRRTLYCRLAAGWSPRDAVFRPVEKRKWNRPIHGTIPMQRGPTVHSNRKVRRGEIYDLIHGQPPITQDYDDGGDA